MAVAVVSKGYRDNSEEGNNKEETQRRPPEPVSMEHVERRNKVDTGTKTITTILHNYGRQQRMTTTAA